MEPRAAVTLFLGMVMLMGLVGRKGGRKVHTAFSFAWCCFVRPIARGDGSQHARLESFYRAQSEIYDRTRAHLLQGRFTLMRLLAGFVKQHQHQQEFTGTGSAARKPIWVDVGGGTGWLIEAMNDVMPLHEFERVYLVDLSESLLAVARKRLARFPNVEILQQDATRLQLPGNVEPDMITMSYSLSMMPEPELIVSRLARILRPGGFFGAVDFYVSRAHEQRPHRRCSRLSRIFWRWWFAWDHVDLHPARRECIEQSFEKRINFSSRNMMLGKYMLPIAIPYYVYVGSSKKTRTHAPDEGDGAGAVGKKHVRLVDEGYYSSEITPASPLGDMPELKLPEAARDSSISSTMSPCAAAGWTENRVPYTFSPDHMDDFIYSFVWEDPATDVELMDIRANDRLLVITSAGDNALHYAASRGCTAIHCVDMNPCQNHILELKLAALRTLAPQDVWHLFGTGRKDDFEAILDTQLAPFLSSEAYAFWKRRVADFEKHGLYRQGYSGIALRLLTIVCGRRAREMQAMASASTLAEQRRRWKNVRDLLFGRLTHIFVLANPLFLWRALGVPSTQAAMIREEGGVLQYAQDTFDPVANAYHLRTQNYHYSLCISQRYTHECCPLYLTAAGMARIRSLDLGAMQLWTGTIVARLRSLPTDSLDKAVVMDHQDWFAPAAFGSAQDRVDGLHAEISEFARVLRSGGAVYWRSAARTPWYASRWALAGFAIECLQTRVPGGDTPLDRVNMYASCWRAVKTGRAG